jgi:hypothetical protein
MIKEILKNRRTDAFEYLYGLTPSINVNFLLARKYESVPGMVRISFYRAGSHDK